MILLQAGMWGAEVFFSDNLLSGSPGSYQVGNAVDEITVVTSLRL